MAAIVEEAGRKLARLRSIVRTEGAPMMESQGLLRELRVRCWRQTGDCSRSKRWGWQLLMTRMPSLPPSTVHEATWLEEAAAARGALECGVLLACRRSDLAALDRAWAQLRPFYSDLGKSLPASTDRAAIVGVRLLALLVDGRTDSFHVEVEALSEAERADPMVAFPMQIEAWMTEGAYNRVLAAARAPPSDLFAAMLHKVVAAVREEISACLGASCRQLALREAQALLFLDSADHVREYIRTHRVRRHGANARSTMPCQPSSY